MPEISVERQFEELRTYLAKRRAEIDIPKETDYFSLFVNRLLVDKVFAEDVQKAVHHGKTVNDDNYKELNAVLEGAGIFVDAGSLQVFASGEFTWASASHIAQLFGNKNIGTFN